MIASEKLDEPRYNIALDNFLDRWIFLLREKFTELSGSIKLTV